VQTFLFYWKPDTVDDELARGATLNHSGSRQFNRVSIGDHVWHATVRDGRLVILGKIIVAHVCDQASAARLLGTDDLWEAPYHIVAVKERVEPIREVMIPNIVEILRFESRHDRLKTIEGRLVPQQLRTMRELSGTSAMDLDAEFRRAVSSGATSR
jgi:hypothetical protein